MDKLRRDKCAILSLVLTGKWYDMIAQGGKREEYRLATKYWRTRFHNWNSRTTEERPPVVEFRLGYASDAPRMAYWCMGLETATGMKPYAFVDNPSGKRHHPEWGEPNEPHFFIELGGSVDLL